MSALKPFLKWAGGKRWLVQTYPFSFPEKFTRLVEPFAGSAAVFFDLRPQHVWLNDLNSELINAYVQIKNDWESIRRLLNQYQDLHSEEFYYAIREVIPEDFVERAARFIYLNRTCFNGIYRVNLKGRFNVPKGTKSSVLMPNDDFKEVASALKDSILTSYDFEVVVDQCGFGDLLFVDPPYTVKHNLNGFIKYNEKLFSWSDQIRLRDALFRAKQRGAKVIVSNADHESIRELYKSSKILHRAERHSVIAADADKRKITTELIITL